MDLSFAQVSALHDMISTAWEQENPVPAATKVRFSVAYNIQVFLLRMLMGNTVVPGCIAVAGACRLSQLPCVVCFRQWTLLVLGLCRSNAGLSHCHVQGLSETRWEPTCRTRAFLHTRGYILLPTAALLLFRLSICMAVAQICSLPFSRLCSDFQPQIEPTAASGCMYCGVCPYT